MTEADYVVLPEFTTEHMKWITTALASWRSDYEGADDVPWDQVVELERYCRLLMDMEQNDYYQQFKEQVTENPVAAHGRSLASNIPVTRTYAKPGTRQRRRARGG